MDYQNNLKALDDHELLTAFFLIIKIKATNMG